MTTFQISHCTTKYTINVLNNFRNKYFEHFKREHPLEIIFVVFVYPNMFNVI